MRSFYANHWFNQTEAQVRMALSIVIMLILDYRLGLVFFALPFMLLGRALIHKLAIAKQLARFHHRLAQWTDELLDLVGGGGEKKD